MVLRLTRNTIKKEKGGTEVKRENNKEQKQTLTFDKVHFTWLQDLFLERQNERHVLGVTWGQTCPVGQHPFPRCAQNEFSVTANPTENPGESRCVTPAFRIEVPFGHRD